MKNLTKNELEEVNGGGFWDDVRTLYGIYQSVKELFNQDGRP